MINAINSINSNCNSRVAFGSVLKMCPTCYCEEEYYQDILELEKRMSQDGKDGEMVLRRFVSPQSNPILAAFSNIPKFVISVKAKIDSSITDLASKTYRNEHRMPINSQDIDIEMRVDAAKLLHGDTAELFSKANVLAEDVQRRIESPAFEVKPEQLAAYREKILVSADSTYDNSTLKYAEKLAGNTEKLIKTGKPFQDAFKEAGSSAFNEMLSNDNYEISSYQAATAKIILNQVWAYGDRMTQI